MKKLREHDLKIFYNTDEDDIINDFYCKVLEAGAIYKRAVAYFSSSSLLSITRGLESLINNNGSMKLLISPNLSEKDIQAIQLGYQNKENIINDFLVRNFSINENEKNQYNYLAWLIYKNKLDIKIVVKKDNRISGLFHEKIGIITDLDGEKIAFNGSMNETGNAFLNNYESINIFRSWDNSEKIRVDKIEENFNEVWENKSKNWESFEFPEAIKKEILSCKSREWAINDNYKNINQPKIPEFIKLRDYQKDAIKKWFNSRCKGIFEMATGTGKTITAISAITKALEICRNNKKSCGVIIVVPYKVLLEQWVEILQLFNIYPVKCYENKYIWTTKLQDEIYLFNESVKKNLFIITTNATFISDNFQALVKIIKKDYILCIDEIHHAATEKFLTNLPENCKLRLGLSATLESNHNKIQMEELKDYFGNIIFEFSLERAIKEGFLTPYYYYPIFVELSDEEKEEYFEISSKIGKLLNVVDHDDDCLTSLLMKRARIMSSSKNKLKKLIELKDKVIGTSFNIFYCGDKIEDDDKFIYKVNRIVSNEFKLKTHTFTSEENKGERSKILKEFSNGNLQAISAIKCLDEGIDIPELRRAFILSSSTNPKEFIQRRGRILRLSQGKEYAEIYDFIVVPSLSKDYISNLTNEELINERKIFFREINRFEEFANLSINSIQANNKLIEVLNLYNIYNN